MKSTTFTAFLALFLGGLLLTGCGGNTDKEKREEVIFGKLELSNGWARPAREGQNSAAYLTITNGTATDDTLKAVSSDAASEVSIHRTEQNADGTMSMAPAGPQAIKAGNDLRLQAGGLHLMLEKVNRRLAAGDSLSLALEFSRVGSRQITIPVRVSQ